MIENIGYEVKKKDILYSLTLGYFVNSFTPKFGEISRCTSLAKSSEIPVSKNLGTVVIERIYDVAILFLGLFIIAIAEIERLGHIIHLLSNNLGSLIASNAYSIILFLILFGGIFYLFFLLSKKIDFLARVKNFISEILWGIKISLNMKRYGTFIFLTFLIWIALIGMNYFFLLSLPQTQNFNIYFAMIVLFVGGIGWALPSPGGIGTTHFIILQLFLAFNLSEESGIAFGIVSNGATFIYTILFGLLAILFYGIPNNKKWAGISVKE